MGLRIFHTADWHLGHSLHGLSREEEHRQFLDWLLNALDERQADALLIAGDVFDSANPPASAQGMLYRFVIEARRRLPRLQIVMIAGNHDSAARIEAPSPVLDALDVHVVGTPRYREDGTLDTERLIVPLLGKGRQIEAWCAAVPFLRPADLRLAAAEGTDPLVSGVVRLYDEVIRSISQRSEPDQALVAMGHCYMVGTRLSELSERKVLGGNQHALPLGLFPEQTSYGALGHLHLAQTVGAAEHIRYAGSPIPLSLDERSYPHQVVQVDLQGARLAAVEAIAVPRYVEIVRFPERGSGELEAVIAALSAFEFDRALPPDRHPYVEVGILLEQPHPGLRRRIEEVLKGRPARLLKLTIEYAGTLSGLTAAVPEQSLHELKPDAVFQERYRQQFDQDPPGDLLAAFHELLEQEERAQA